MGGLTVPLSLQSVRGSTSLVLAVTAVAITSATFLRFLPTFFPSILGPPSSKRRQAHALGSALSSLRDTFPATQLGSTASELALFGTSWGSILPISPPTIIVYVESTEDVVKVVKIANEWGIVVIPVGGRTSLEGQFLPPQDDKQQQHCCGGRLSSWFPSSSTESVPSSPKRPVIHLSLERMNNIIKIYEQDQQATVEPGVGWQSLNSHLSTLKIPLFFPIDPGPGAHFGGMTAVGGSGTNAVHYGTMKSDWILGMQVVLMSGEVIETRGKCRARKTSTGWDVGRLFMGSEGTLGIITRLNVRLAPVIPLKVALTSFPTVSSAVSAVISIISTGLAPISLELLDGLSIRGLNLANLLPEKLEERPTVLMRFSSPVEGAIDVILEKVKEICMDNGAAGLRVAKDEEENEEIWKARKNQFWSQQLLIGEGCRTLITDVCVPISRLAEFIDRSEKDVEKSGLLAPIVAHIGDGNVHRAILFRSTPEATSAPAEVMALASCLAKLAIELEGTCAGEHGIGTNKRQYLKSELGEGTLGVMRKVKELLDPRGLLNPGKVLFE